MSKSTSMQTGDLADGVPALREALGFAPAETSEAAGWTNASLCVWRGSAEICEYVPFREVVLAFQTGGPPLRVRVDGRWVDAYSRPGLLTIVPPATPVTWQVNGKVHSATLHLPQERFENLLDDGDGATLLRDLRFDFARHEPLLAASIFALIDEVQHPTERGSLYAETVVDAICMHLLRFAGQDRTALQRPESLSRRALDATLARIEASIGTGVSLDELARTAGSSRAHFTRAFRRAMGTSPRRYLTKRRIECARDLLRDTDDEIVEIALACGFSSQAHFTDAFRQATGVTPFVFRRSGR